MLTPKAISLLQLLWVKTVLSNNFGPPVQVAYAPSTQSFTQWEDPGNPFNNASLVLPNLSPRRLNMPYTIIYPLTFPQNRGGKPLNYSLASQLPLTDEVQSRVINSPEVYPNFGFYRSILPQDTTEKVAQPPEENTFDDSYEASDLADDDNRIKVVSFPPSSAQYYPKTNSIYSIKPAYQNKSATAVSPVVENKQQNIKFPSFGYGKYPPPAYKPPPQESITPVNPQQILPPPKAYLKPVTPPQFFPQRPAVPVIKSSIPPAPLKPTSNKQKTKVKQPSPKNDIKPTLSVKNQVPPPSPPAGPPPYGIYKKQSGMPPAVPRAPQYTSCVCVPYYLCKDGILNSGGRLQELRRRGARSLNYILQNKNSTSIPIKSNIVNLYPAGRNLDQDACEPNKVCCEIYFEGGTEDRTYDEKIYPVATPPPERPFFPPPVRYPQKQRTNTCGVQRALGVQTKLNQAGYPADVADFGEYPWQIAILRKNYGEKNLYLCGGVMVAPQWVATVAHCVRKYKRSPLLVRLGEWDVNRKDEVYPYVEKDVTKVVIHPNFDPESLQGDLALLRLSNPIDVNTPHITPACLPTPGQVYEDPKCWVTGWGKNFFGPQGEYQNVLKEVDIPVVSRSLCSTQLRSTNLGPDFTLHPGFLCAGGEVGKDACTGDGGSPLVCKSGGVWYVVGLVSWGIGCGQAGVPGVYVNVLYYTDWINNVIQSS